MSSVKFLWREIKKKFSILPKISTREEDSDLIHFWGTYYGSRATHLLETGWREVSLSPSWTNFIALNDPALNPYVLPAIPGVEGSKRILFQFKPFL